MKSAHKLGAALLTLAACVSCTLDSDGDGYRDPWGGSNPDCAPNDPNRYPGAPEVCNGLDDNCDGVVDEVGLAYYADTDGDGLGFGRITGYACSLESPTGTSFLNSDCDDSDPHRGLTCGSAPEPDERDTAEIETPTPEAIAAYEDRGEQAMVTVAVDLDDDERAELVRIAEDGVLQWTSMQALVRGDDWTSSAQVDRWGNGLLAWAPWAPNGRANTHIALLERTHPDAARIVLIDLLALASLSAEEAEAQLEQYLEARESGGADEGSGAPEGSGEPPQAERPEWWTEVARGVHPDAEIRMEPGEDSPRRLVLFLSRPARGGGSMLSEYVRAEDGTWLGRGDVAVPDHEIADVRVRANPGRRQPGVLVCARTARQLLGVDTFPGAAAPYGASIAGGHCMQLLTDFGTHVVAAHGPGLPYELIAYDAAGDATPLVVPALQHRGTAGIAIAELGLDAVSWGCRPVALSDLTGAIVVGCLDPDGDSIAFVSHFEHDRLLAQSDRMRFVPDVDADGVAELLITAPGRSAELYRIPRTAYVD